MPEKNALNRKLKLCAYSSDNTVNANVLYFESWIS